MKHWLLAAVLFLPAPLPAPAAAVTCSLEAKNVQMRDGGAVPAQQLFSTVNPQVLFAVPQGKTGKQLEFEKIVAKQPKYRCDAPCKGLITVGGEKLLVALDGESLERGYDTLYIDLNRNLDLTDDKPVSLPVPSATAAMDSHRFSPVDIKLADGNGTFTWTVLVDAYVRRSDREGPRGTVYFRAATYREGTVELDGKPVHIVLLDYNSNGRYNDETTVDPKGNGSSGLLYARTGDHLLIDPAGKAPVYSYYFMTSLAARNPISKLACINGKYYECSVAPSGATIKLEPVEQPMGSLAYDAPRWQMLLLGDAGVIKVMGERGHPAPVPAGEWKLVEYTAYYGARQVRTPADLTLIAAHGVANASAIMVQAGKTTSAPCGGPYQLDVVPAPAKSGTSELTLRIAGRAGEECNNLLVQGKRPPEPTLVIATADGKKVANGAFEYG